MKIPKIFHQIWVGPDPIPERTKEYTEKWKQLHPDWELWLWQDDDVAELDLYNQEIYDTRSSWAGKADVLRIELLYWYGGVYMDIDYECVQPLTPLIEDFDFFISKDEDKWVAPNIFQMGLNLSCIRKYYINGMIGATPKHPYVKRMRDELTWWLSKLRSTWPAHETGPTYVSYILKDEEVPQLPISTFNGDYAIHRYLGSWNQD